MANKTIAQIANTKTSVVAGDLIAIWNDAQSRTDVISPPLLVGATITGNGTIATGGYDLTVPTSGTVALLGTENVFIATQRISPPSPSHGLIIDMPSSGGRPLYVQLNGVTKASMSANATDTLLELNAFNNGASTGCRLGVGNNNHPSTPAPGFLLLYAPNGNFFPLWADNSGVIRTDTSNVQPTSGTTGSVVGAQTSMAAAKHISDELSLMDEVADRIRAGADAVRRFTYKSGAFGGQEFEGVVIDDAPEYGMDRDAEHPAGKSLNEINIAGDLLRFAAWAMQRIEDLESKRIH